MKVLYVGSENGSDVRTQKMLKSFLTIADEVHFAGWLRSEDKKPYNLPGVHCHFHQSNTGFSGLKVLKGLPRFWLFVRRTVKKIKPDAVVVANEENAWLEGFFRDNNILYVCDVADTIADRLNYGRQVNRLGAVVQKAVFKRFDRLIFTDQIRLERTPTGPIKSLVIYNAPYYKEIVVEQKKQPQSIYWSGNLNNDRGITTLIQAVKLLRHQGKDYNILVAGDFRNLELKEMVLTHEFVKFVGHVSHDQSLDLAANCMATFAYYDPVIINNVYASPNKLYECMMLKNPILINTECIVSEFVIKNRLGLAAPYLDAEGLASNISKIAVKEFIPNDLADEFRRFYAWDNAAAQLARMFTIPD